MIDWSALERSIDGEVALPGSPAYEAAHRTFNARFRQVVPQAVVSCATPQDVAGAISFARRNDVEMAARGGGHSFAGHSTTRGLVIDLSPMRSVTLSGNVATIGAGARLGDVYEVLERDGVAIPAGTCPSVGVAGLTLGGGLGILGRTYGVTSDYLAGAEIVLADGRRVTCDEDREQDLFWALRGGGAGSLGVVTSFVFRTVPAPEATNVHLSWPFADAASAIEAWQSWAPNGPDELAASLKVTSTAEVDRPPSIDVYASVIGTTAVVSDVLDELVARVGSDPVSSSQEPLPFAETRRFWAELGAEGDAPHVPPQTSQVEPVFLFTKSEFLQRPLPLEGIRALVEAFGRDRAPGESRELDFMPWAGAYNRVPSGATAFVHRDELFQLKHSVVVQRDATASQREAARRAVTHLWGSVHPWGSGRVFQNFADSDLPVWSEAYYGPNLSRLLAVKERYDPVNVFNVVRTP
jgi:FAD/FMN-containing dehydrogenase